MYGVPGWEDSLKSRGPSPDEVASQREEEHGAGSASVPPTYTEKESRLLQGVFKELMKKGLIQTYIA